MNKMHWIHLIWINRNQGQGKVKEIENKVIFWELREYNETIEKEREKSFKLTAVLNISPPLISEILNAHIIIIRKGVAFGIQPFSIHIEMKHDRRSRVTSIQWHFYTNISTARISKLVLTNGRFFNSPENTYSYELLTFFSDY